MPENELKDLQLEGNIEAVRKATESFGGKLEVLTNEQALEKYGRQVTGANGFFAPKYDKGIAFDDEQLKINWQLSAEELQLSDKDKAHPTLANSK